ncbi:MAG: helix-turn-helix transcriptional regulator, partial [Chitinophagaceae bacterium]|nr:helix-turn-helix transcriptional regulator [Chitinophagaceae bacterium]
CIHDSLDTEKAIREILKEDLSGFLGLTHTEAEVLRHKRKGWLSKEIAAVMKCKLATVTSHLRNIYRKLGVNNQMEAIYLVFPPSWK